MATTTSRINSQINSAEVREVRAQFERWRGGKHGRERIPPKLWGMAAKLCETYSLNRVARSLGLNYTALKVEVDRRVHPHRRRPTAPAKPAFVEWSLPPEQAGLPAGMVSENSSAEYVVEAPDRRHETLRIHVRGASVLEVAALISALRTGDGASGHAG